MNARRPYEGSLGLLLMTWLYRLVLLLTMMAGVCKFSTMPIRLMSAECAVALVSYVFLMLIAQNVYRSCDVGLVSVTELVMSQLLANLISAGGIYLGVSLYVHKMFNPLPMLLVTAVQAMEGIIWSILANHHYFLKRRSPRTAVVYRGEDSLEKLYQSPYFHSKYDVCKLIADPVDDIPALKKELEGCEVVFTLGIPATLTNGIAKLCLQMGLTGYFMPHLGHIIMTGAEYMSTYSVPMLRVQRAGRHSEYRAFKRMFDLAGALIGLIVLAPIMLVTALAIWLEDHGPVFYRQVRLTKNGREFQIYKFRSMKVNAERDGVARLAGQNDSRITKVGHFIRACRIDELPQLLNILQGDMSIVGPRPERPEIAEQYEQELPEFSLRLQVKAGLTGLAQVYGRYNTEPYNKLQMDLMYINEMSFLKDLQLILATIKILFVKESTQGVAHGKATAMDGTKDKLHKSA